MSIVEVTLLDETGAVSQAGFGMPLVFDPMSDIEYQEVESAGDITGATSGDMVYEMVQTAFSQDLTPSKIAVHGVDLGVEDDIGGALDDLKQDGFDDFYFLLLASREGTDIQDAGSWAGGNGKLFVSQPDINATIQEILDIKESLSSDRSVLYAHDGGNPEVDPYTDAAIVGRIAPVNPGGTTWKFKNLNGVPVATYSMTEVGQLADDNVNTYVKELGVLQTSDGKTTGGSYADIQRGKDWLSARIKESIGRLLITSEKVGYTDGGIAQVIAELKGVLKGAVNRQLIAKDDSGSGMFTIDIPARSDISANNIANRILPDINFEATIAGAIHNVEVTGVLKV